MIKTAKFKMKQASCEGCSKLAKIECPHSYWIEDMNKHQNYCIEWERR